MPPPFDQGYLAFDFSSTNTLIADAPTGLPTKIVAKFYECDFSAQPPRHYVGTEIVILLEKGSTRVTPLALPALPETAFIQDARFTNKHGKSFKYLESGGTWVPRNSDDPIKILEQKPKVPSYNVEPILLKKPSSALAITVLALAFIAPVLFLAVRSLQKLKTKNKP
jgi:hypothetical protein